MVETDTWNQHQVDFPSIGWCLWLRNAEFAFFHVLFAYIFSQLQFASMGDGKIEMFVGGSVLKGETSLQGALREVREEVGLSLDAGEGRLIFTKIRETVDGKRFNDIVDVWLFPYDGAVDLSKAATDEVAQVRWISADEIEELFASGEMVHTIKDLFYIVAEQGAFGDAV